jgi:hypothetical protein
MSMRRVPSASHPRLGMSRIGRFPETGVVSGSTRSALDLSGSLARRQYAGPPSHHFPQHGCADHFQGQLEFAAGATMVLGRDM